MPRLNPIDTKKVGYSALSDKFMTQRLVGSGIIPPEMFTSAGDISIPEVLINENIEDLTEINNETQSSSDMPSSIGNVIGNIEESEKEVAINELLEDSPASTTIAERIIEKIIEKNIISQEKIPDIIQNITNMQQDVNTENISQNIQSEKIEQIIQNHATSIIQPEIIKEIVSESLADASQSHRIEPGAPASSEVRTPNTGSTETIVEHLNEKTETILEMGEVLKKINITNENNNTQFIKESPITQNLIGGIEETNITNEGGTIQQKILNNILENNVSNTDLRSYNKTSQINTISNNQNISNINNTNEFSNINNTNTESNILQILSNQNILNNNPILNSIIGSNVGFIPETGIEQYTTNQNETKSAGFGDINEIYQRAVTERQNEIKNVSQKILEPVGVVTPSEKIIETNMPNIEEETSGMSPKMTYENFSNDVKQYNPNISENIIKKQYDNYLLKQETIKTVEKENISSEIDMQTRGDNLRERYESQNNLSGINDIINLIKSEEFKNLFKKHVLFEYKTSKEVEETIEEKINKYNNALGLDLDGKL